MAKYKSQVDAITAVTVTAEAEVGYLEKASNSNLDSKTGNAGYNNYTKYWRDIAKLGLLKGTVSDPNFAGGSMWYWCAAFITWCFIQVFGVDLTKTLLKHIPFISCQTLADKAGGQLYSSPKVGDIVLFFNGSRFSHTGYVYKVEGGWFYTIEGNTNASKGVVPNGGGVNRKSYSISTYQKKGTKFFRPDYSLAVDKNAGSSNSSGKTTTKTTKVKVVTKSDPLNCRSKANGSSTVKGKFAKGTKLTLVEKTNNSWWKVKGKSTDGKTITGYCSTTYLKIV